MTKTSRTTDMTQGSEMRHIIMFSLPLLAGNLLQQTYNIVDTMVVGRYLGDDALAAVGATGSITYLFYTLCIGLSVGAGIIVAQYFGAGKKKALRSAVFNSALVTAIFGIVISLLSVPAARTLDDEGCVLVYESDDLINWKYTGKVYKEGYGYMWECPDYFEIDGKGFLSTCPQGMPHYETKWQNLNESGYFPVQGKLEDSVLGDFTEWDMGFDFYAPHTFLDPQGRRILIGWLGMDNKAYGNATTELGWQHCLTIPRVVTVAPNGKLRQQPIAEFDELKSNARRQSSGQTAEYPLPFELDGEPADSFSITLDGKLELGFDKEKNLFTMKFTDEKYGCGRTVRNAEIDNVRNIRVIADMSSIEVYINDGETVMSTRIYPDNDSVKLKVNGFEAQVWDI